MIIVRLTGGLGNQMFIYALGRSLASKHGVPLHLDLSEFERYKLHKYSLDHFRIVHEPISADLQARLAVFDPRSLGQQLWFGFARGVCAWRYPRLVRERHFHFDPNVLDAKPPAYLMGYWQSEKYFADVATTIRDDFTVIHPLAGRNQEIAAAIAESESISVHVRRGDYVTNPTTLEIHGVCSIAYYQKAVAEIAARHPNARCFVFSDDAAWCRANLQLHVPMTFVDHNDASTNYEDLRLMSLCRHQVIANSSFSWWGAWLNRNPDKMVFAPRRWFNDDTRQTHDVCPPAWTRL